MNWLKSLRRKLYWKRRIRAFDKRKAKAIQQLTPEDLIYLEEYYNERIPKGSEWVIPFKWGHRDDKLRIKNSRAFAEWMIERLKK